MKDLKVEFIENANMFASIAVNGIFFLENIEAKEKAYDTLVEKYATGIPSSLILLAEDILKMEEDAENIACLLWGAGAIVTYSSPTIRMKMVQLLLTSETTTITGNAQEEIIRFKEQMSLKYPEKVADENLMAAISILICAMLNTASQMMGGDE